jgi:uncharacterized protein (UPF0248 family)
MLPIDKLLSRMRWDPAFRAGQLEVGYYDRLQNRIVRVLFEELRQSAANPRMLELYDADGNLRRIPLHRVRRVYRDGRVIWERRPLHEHPQDDTARLLP